MLPHVASGKHESLRATIGHEGEVVARVEIHRLDASSGKFYLPVKVCISWDVADPVPEVLDALISRDERAWLDWLIATFGGRCTR